jgi:hypothetical protein
MDTLFRNLVVHSMDNSTFDGTLCHISAFEHATGKYIVKVRSSGVTDSI